jgi:hypothetical protein
VVGHPRFGEPSLSGGIVTGDVPAVTNEFFAHVLANHEAFIVRAVRRSICAGALRVR